MGNLYEVQMPGRPDGPNAAPLNRLTPRQLEVLGMLCEGLSNKLIARRLNISSGTVKVHVVHILRALKVSSRLQAVLIARNAGLEAKLQQVAANTPAAAPASAARPTLAEIMATRREPAPRIKIESQKEPLLLGTLMRKRLDAVA